MKKILTFALAAMVALSASAAKKKTAAKDANKPVFTIIRTVQVPAGITLPSHSSRPRF